MIQSSARIKLVPHTLRSNPRILSNRLAINMILVLLIFSSLLLYYLWQRRHLLRLAAKLKGLKGYPLIGSAYKFLDANREYRWCSMNLAQLATINLKSYKYFHTVRSYLQRFWMWSMSSIETLAVRAHFGWATGFSCTSMIPCMPRPS